MYCLPTGFRKKTIIILNFNCFKLHGKNKKSKYRNKQNDASSFSNDYARSYDNNSFDAN